MRLKKFNVQKESKRLQNYHNKSNNIKKRTIILSAFILVASIILLTYASFSSSIKVDVMHSKVGDLVQTDYKLKIYVDDALSNNVPESDDGYVVDSIICTNNATGTWDDSNWGLLVTNATEPTECSVYFVEASAPAAPELYNGTSGKAGLIPVKYGNNGTTIVADPDNHNNDWYDYDNHEWANAVLVSNYSDYYDEDGKLIESTIGETITTSDILQYYVWIPRYRYKLFNAVAGELADEQMIEVEFEDAETPKSDGDENGEWLTHPAFTFGNTELNGFWVGKFRSSYVGVSYGYRDTNSTFNCYGVSCSYASNVRIIPNAYVLVFESFKNQFYITRSIESNSTFNLDKEKLDTHMIKNMEWGAIAYLTNSIYGRYISPTTCVDGGCEIWTNLFYENYYGYKTGCSANSISDSRLNTCVEWYTSNGVHASTTDNIYGIYDLASVNPISVMGNVSRSSSNYVWNPGSNTGFSSYAIDSKYYDAYDYTNNNKDYNIGKLGDATRELLKNENGYTGWFDDSIFFPIYSNETWFERGGYWSTNGTTFARYGLHSSYRTAYGDYNAFLVVISAEDN